MSLPSNVERHQVDARDWSEVSVSLFLKENSSGDAVIGMKEKQALTCSLSSANSSSAYLDLGFMGNRVMVPANATISDLRLDAACRGGVRREHTELEQL